MWAYAGLSLVFPCRGAHATFFDFCMCHAHATPVCGERCAVTTAPRGRQNTRSTASRSTMAKASCSSYRSIRLWAEYLRFHFCYFSFKHTFQHMHTKRNDRRNDLTRHGSRLVHSSSFSRGCLSRISPSRDDVAACPCGCTTDPAHTLPPSYPVVESLLNLVNSAPRTRHSCQQGGKRTCLTSAHVND